MSKGEGFLALLLQQQGSSIGVSRIPEGLEYAQGAIQALHEIGDLSDQEAATWVRRFNDVSGYSRPTSADGAARVGMSQLSKADAAYASERQPASTERLFEPQAFVRVVTIEISKMTDPSGRTYQYHYDNNCNLLTVTDPANKVTTFGYDSSFNLTQITDPNGNITKLSYDSATRVTSMVRVTNISLGTGPTSTYSYTTGTGSCAPAPPGDAVYEYTVSTDANSRATTYCIDHRGLVIQTIDPNQNGSTASYTSDNHVGTETDALGQSIANGYNGINDLNQVSLPAIGSGQTGPVSTQTFQTPTTVSGYQYLQSSTVDPQGNCEADIYDAVGNLVDAYAGQVAPCDGHTGGSHLSHRFQGDPGINCGARPGELCSTGDADANVTTYGYDAYGNRTSITPPAPLGATTILPDSLSRTATTTDGKGQKTSYSYDALDRTTQILYNGATTCNPSAGTCITYSYDPDGNLTSMTDNTGTTAYYYDALNELTTESLPDTAADCSGSSPAGLTFAYDPVGNLTQYCDSGGTVTYSYDAGGRLSSMAEPGGNCGTQPSLCTTFAYNADGQRTTITFPGGATLNTSYDSDQNISSVVGKDKNGAVLTSFGYTYNNGNVDTQLRQSMTEADAVANNTYSYSYDSLNRLTRATITAGAGTSYTYSYDPNGNMLSKGAGSANTSYAYAANNELCWAYSGLSTAGCSAPPSGATTYSFDANGNGLGNSSGQSYSYNAKDQTTSITYGGTTLTPLAYAGPGQAQRVTAASTSFDSSSTGLQIASTSGTSVYFLRDSLGALIGERVGGTHYYYLRDGLGSIVAVITGDGLTVGDRYGYDPYGGTTYHSGSISNPWGFAGGYTDPTGLIKFGARYYDPAIARWSQVDPVSLPNGYAYAGCDPVDSTDPSGFASVTGNCGTSTLLYNHWTGYFAVSLRSSRGPMTWINWSVSLNGWWWWLANYSRSSYAYWSWWWAFRGYVPFSNWASDATNAAFTGYVWIGYWIWPYWLFCWIGPVFVYW